MLLPEPRKENNKRLNIFLFFNIKVLFMSDIALFVVVVVVVVVVVLVAVAVITVSVVYTSMEKNGRVPLFQ